MIALNDESIKKRVEESTLPLLLYFYSPMQVPCLLVERSLENLEKAYEGRLEFYKIDIQEAVTTCLRLQVMSVPKMLIIKNGEVIAKRMGSASSSVIESFIKAHI